MVDSESEQLGILSLFHYFFENGVEEKKNKWNSESMLMRLINRNSKKILLNIIKELGFKGDYGITARSGSSGRWSNTPYICIIRGKPNGINRQYSADNGIYPALLFSDTCSEIYLAFMISVGSKTDRELKRCIEQIRLDVGSTSFSYDTDSMTIGDKQHHYREATSFFRCYRKGELLTEDMFKTDLFEMLQIQKVLGSEYYRNIVVLKSK